jgi:hypothetical protein
VRTEKKVPLRRGAGLGIIIADIRLEDGSHPWSHDEMECD